MMRLARHSNPQDNSYSDFRQPVHFTSPPAVGKMRGYLKHPIVSDREETTMANPTGKTDKQTSGVYRRRIGDALVTTINDGFLDILRF
jgi:hypothetical protein